MYGFFPRFIMKNNRHIFSFLIFLFLLLFFVKTDYRFVSSINCCGDDYDYFIHAVTITTDFDLDYSNQLNEENHIRYNGKIAPKGFIGTGIMASPFLFIGNLLNKIFANQSVFNFQILMYSLSSIFYLLISYWFLVKTILRINKDADKILLTLLFFGSGVSYYAFERFSMTHVYEVFISSLIIYLSTNYCFEKDYSKKNLLAFVIPLSIILGILVRWTNYYLFVLPVIVIGLIGKNRINENQIYKNKFTWISMFISITAFSMLSKGVYGKVTFNPQFVYSNNRLDGFFSLSFDFIQTNLLNLWLILFGQEFGLFWVSTVIAFGFFISVNNFLYSKNKLTYLFLLLSYMQVIATILVWKTTASSYGMRYAFSLIPISLVLVFLNNKLTEIKIIKIILYTLSVFGIISVLFFEADINTQLSIEPIVNSFGTVDVRYSNPNYVSGVLKTLTNIDSYLSVISRSFIGALVLKLITVFYNQNNFLVLLDQLGLPVENEDFILLIDKVKIIQIENFIVFSTVIFLILYFLLKSLSLKSK
jgi:hypothetical protein